LFLKYLRNFISSIISVVLHCCTLKDRKRDYALKSPGIKPQAAARGGITNAVKGARVLPPQLPSTVANHTDGGHDNDLSSSETDLGTPPTPSTPMTPPHDSTDVGSVFNDSAITSKYTIYNFIYIYM